MPDQPPNQHIHIERLVIRTRGLPESTVRAALAGLDTALLTAVAHHAGFQSTPAVIDHLNVAPVQARGDSQQLRQAIAHQVVASLSHQTSPSPPPSPSSSSSSPPPATHP